jgi:hypothetical protein
MVREIPEEKCTLIFLHLLLKIKGFLDFFQFCYLFNKDNFTFIH